MNYIVLAAFTFPFWGFVLVCVANGLAELLSGPHPSVNPRLFRGEDGLRPCEVIYGDFAVG
mgnify:CR=1 FL=1